MNNKIICLIGPTATGKTLISLELASKFSLEIISVDSALIYREMNIGTAKPSLDILASIPHHLINIKDPAESYSAAEFCHDANLLIRKIHERGKIPLFVGGTMMYYRSLQQGMADLPPANLAIRLEIDQRAADLGWPALHAELAKIDVLAAQRIHPNDPQRIQRALEVFYISDKPLSEFFTNQLSVLDLYEHLNLAILPNDRQLLHNRIATRFHQMLEEGLIEEVEQLRSRGDLNLDLPSMRSVGYRQVWQYLQDDFDYMTMQEKGIIATRQLAKRQITWLRSFEDLNLLTMESPHLLHEAIKQCEKFLFE